ncbi:hypothetical protein ACN42_g11647, partial [Penicillium freii]
MSNRACKQEDAVVLNHSVEYQAWCMVGITKPIQTGKSMDRHDNGTIQNYI